MRQILTNSVLDLKEGGVSLLFIQIFQRPPSIIFYYFPIRAMNTIFKLLTPYDGIDVHTKYLWSETATKNLCQKKINLVNEKFSCIKMYILSTIVQFF